MDKKKERRGTMPEKKALIECLLEIHDRISELLDLEVDEADEPEDE